MEVCHLIHELLVGTQIKEPVNKEMVILLVR